MLFSCLTSTNPEGVGFDHRNGGTTSARTYRGLPYFTVVRILGTRLELHPSASTIPETVEGPEETPRLVRWCCRG